MTTRTCPACLSDLDDDALAFCTTCGAALSYEEAELPPSPTTVPIVINRRAQSFRSATPMLAEEPEPDVVISRNWSTLTRPAGAPANQLGRQRKIAGDLPAWDPLPPGERVVKRKSTK